MTKRMTIEALKNEALILHYPASQIVVEVAPRIYVPLQGGHRFAFDDTTGKVLFESLLGSREFDQRVIELD